MKVINVIFPLVFIFTTGVLNAQKINFKEKLELKEADYKLDEKDYLGALKVYQKYYDLALDVKDLDYKMALCLFYLNEDLLKAKELFAESKNKESLYYLGQLYHLYGAPEKALAAFQEYKLWNGKKAHADEELDELMRMVKRSIRMKKYPVDVSIYNMGELINSKYPDYVPLISADETMLIFTSRRAESTGGLLDPYGQYFEDIYISYNKNNQWSKPVGIGANINTDGHNACVGLSPEGNTLILYNTSEDLLGGDLYWSEIKGNSWSDPVKYNDHINSDFQEASASFAPDGNTLYFSSSRPGGFGGKDIYRSIKFGNGDWSLPVNIGEPINTPYDEDAPFMHTDGKTMYFSSNGHKTMGKYDIFKSEMDEAGWSEPKNMGYPINSENDDIYFVVSANGKTGYFSSIKESGFGDKDLYYVNLDDAHRPIVRGKILASSTDNTPLQATITLEDEAGGEVYGVYRTNSRTGNYIMVINEGKTYKMIIEADGFQSVQKSFTLTRGSSEDKEEIIDLYLDEHN